MGRRSHVAQIKNLFARKTFKEAKLASDGQISTGVVASCEVENRREARSQANFKSCADETLINVAKMADSVASFSNESYAEEMEKSVSLIRCDPVHSILSNSKEVLHLDRDKSNSEEVSNLSYLERSFKSEQVALTEKCQQENAELRELHAQDNRLMRKAFENEKSELLRELETQRCIMDELVTSMKRAHQQDVERVEREMQASIQQHREALASLNVMLNEFFTKIEKVSDCLAQCPLQQVLGEIKDTCQEHLMSPASRSVHFFSSCLDHTMKPVRENAGSVDMKERQMCTSPEKRTSCELERISDQADESEIQQEINAAYKKQKSELLQLFADEKRALENHLEKVRAEFESKTRSEYETRTLIERRAWQETIQEYEREIAILKFEREQMDRSYCLEMDKLKTEFEMEKMFLHRALVQQDARSKLGDQFGLAALRSRFENASVREDIKAC